MTPAPAVTPEQRQLLALHRQGDADIVSGPIPRCRHDGWIRVSASQAALWYFCRHQGGSDAYSIPRVFEIDGPLDVERLSAALSRVVERHEVLRTIFGERQGEPFQLVQPAAAIALPVVDLVDGDVNAWLRREAARSLDISTDAMLQARLARTGERKHLLLLLWHHLVSDQRSGRILDDELSQLYRGQEPEALTIQFGDYAEWEFASRQGRNSQDRSEFWKRFLSGAPPLIDLGYGRTRPAERNYHGRIETFDIDQSSADRIRVFGITQRLTLFPIFLAAFSLLLRRYSGRTDLVVGVPMTGRDAPELERLIGYFVNLLPLRLEVRDGATFEELARDCWARFSKCAASTLPFETILDVVRPERHRSYSPLVQYVLGYLRESKEESLHLEGTTTRKVSFHNGASPFDVTVTILDRASRIRVLVEYNPALFDARAIRQLGDHFLEILKEATIAGTVRIGSLDMLTAAERQAILQTRNATRRALDSSGTVLDGIELQARRNPARVALRTETRSWTAGELNALADHVCAALEGCGIQPGDVVAVDAVRTPETLAVMLGIWKAGAVWLPIDPRWPVERGQFAVSDSGARLEIDAGWLAEHEGAKGSRMRSRASAGAVAYILYTSGSTGQPKGVAIRHDALLNCLLSLQQRPGLSAADTLLSVTPLSFDISLSEVLLPLVIGATLVFPDLGTATNPQAVRRLHEAHHVTVMQATPGMWRILIEEGWTGSSTLRAWCGGEAMPASLGESLLDRTAEVWNLYGPTETTIWSTVHRVVRGDSPVPIGRPIANTQCYVLDADLQPVPDGVPGQLFIGGVGVSPGYIGHARDHADERFLANPFDRGGRIYRTGDVALWTLAADGGADLVFLHRDDAQVKVRGHRIELGDVEAALSRLPAVRQAAAGVHDDTLVAWVVPADPGVWQPQQLRAELRARLPDYMIPGIFVAVDQLPLNSSGKVDRQKLPLPQRSPLPSGNDRPPPDLATAATENTIREIWEELLNVRPIGRHDNFFDLGGHSLLVVKVHGLVEGVFGRRLPDSALIEAPTVAGLASILRAQAEGRSSLLVALQSLGERPPFFVVHAGGGSVVNLRELGQMLGPEQPVYGIQSAGVDGIRPHHIRIEGMASCYLQEIRAIQPVGPYYIGGYCFGAIVALEMAQQLVAGGEQVGMLAILSGALRSARLDASLLGRTHQFLRRWLLMPTKEKLAHAVALGPRAIRALIATMRGPASDLDIPIPTGLFSVNTAHQIAERRYKPQAFAHRITLFRTMLDASPVHDPTFGWAALAPNGLALEDIPGSHVSSLTQPHVKVLAARLGHHLRVAQDHAETRTV